MTAETLLFPRCGITYADVLKVAEMAQNIGHAADLCGVYRSHFYVVIQERGLRNLFRRAHRAILSREDVEGLAGYLMSDAAELAGVSFSCFSRTVARHNLRHLFPAYGGESVHVAKRGYIHGR